MTTVPCDATRKTFDGKNWEQLVEDITASDYDLVVLGARGHGTQRRDAVGSVCLRVLRHTRTDALVVKEPARFDEGADGPILVALDGSAESFRALQAALRLARAYARPVEAVAAYDPHFHYAVFNSLVGVLSNQTARVFRFKEQERLHQEIVDTGLARLYQTHLEVAQHLAEAEGVSLRTTLLAGRAAEVVLHYAEQRRPWLLSLGRIGVHSRASVDIGSVTEHLLRLAPCNLLVASQRFTPPLDVWGQASVRWTAEATALLDRAAPEQRPALRLFMHRLAAERGDSVVTTSLAQEALEVLRPRPETLQRMEQAALAVAAEALRQEPGRVYLCPRCGHAARRQRPPACPACQAPGASFLSLDPTDLAVLPQSASEEV